MPIGIFSDSVGAMAPMAPTQTRALGTVFVRMGGHFFVKPCSPPGVDWKEPIEFDFIGLGCNHTVLNLLLNLNEINFIPTIMIKN